MSNYESFLMFLEEKEHEVHDCKVVEFNFAFELVFLKLYLAELKWSAKKFYVALKNCLCCQKFKKRCFVSFKTVRYSIIMKDIFNLNLIKET